MNFNIIVAMDENRGIGYQNKLPWDLPPDMKYFKDITIKTKDPSKINAVIMGRKTWDSIPKQFKPLSRRLNIVLSRDTGADMVKLDDGYLVNSFENALGLIGKFPDSIENIFVIGGGQVYEEAIKHKNCEKLYITEVMGSFVCDVRFPDTRRFMLDKATEYMIHGLNRFRYTEYVPDLKIRKKDND